MSHDANRFDPLFGWVLKDHQGAGSGFSTRHHGIRDNGDRGEGLLSERPILAVGDSFVAGSEVVNKDTWPAQLEPLLGVQVLNAGVGGYGVDQIYLRARHLAYVLNPRHILFGLLESDIDRMEFDCYGAPKPYFGKDHFLVTDHLQPKGWHSYFKWNHFTKHEHGYLPALRQIVRDLRQWTVPITIILQHGAPWNSQPTQSPNALALIEMAHEAGIPLINEREMVRKWAPSGYKPLYVMQPDGQYGHMSPLGNKLVAELIARELRL